MSTFHEYLVKFQDLNCGRVGNHERPHKPVMLLAVLDLAESGQLVRNEIILGPELLERFRLYFDIVRTNKDQPTPINPFFYLRGDGFWHHLPLPGQESTYRAMSTPGSMGMLNGIVACGRMLVEAAHLVPFAETRDDDPRNGMALCKNHHWAMDQFLIAPGPDKAWHVSVRLDDRMEGQQELLRLRGRTILLPGDTRYHPRQDSLEWRVERLSGKN